jgi:hypothetical protein
VLATQHTHCPQKLALTSPTRGGRSVDIVRSRTKCLGDYYYYYYYYLLIYCNSKWVLPNGSDTTRRHNTNIVFYHISHRNVGTTENPLWVVHSDAKQAFTQNAYEQNSYKTKFR